MSYKEQPLHLHADADYFTSELTNPTDYNTNVEERIESIDDLEYAKLVIHYLVEKFNKVNQ